MVKWQLLSDLLNCSMKIVSIRSSCGAICDARLQCLEALKLAIKLRAFSQYVHVLHWYIVLVKFRETRLKNLSMIHAPQTSLLKYLYYKNISYKDP